MATLFDLLERLFEERAPLFKRVMEKKCLRMVTCGKNIIDEREHSEPFNANYICFEDEDGNWYVVFATYNGRVCMCKHLTRKITRRDGELEAKIDWDYVKDEPIFTAFKCTVEGLDEEIKRMGFEEIHAIGEDNDPTQLLVFVNLRKLLNVRYA